MFWGVLDEPSRDRKWTFFEIIIFYWSGNIFFSKIFLHTPTISLERAARGGPQNVVALKKKTIINYMYKPLTYYHNKPNSILDMNIAEPEIKYLTFEDSHIRKRVF